MTRNVLPQQQPGSFHTGKFPSNKFNAEGILGRRDEPSDIDLDKEIDQEQWNKDMLIAS